MNHHCLDLDMKTLLKVMGSNWCDCQCFGSKLLEEDLAVAVAG